MRVYLINAFTYRGRGGNGAGVVICEDFPPTDIMQETAKQVGLSETVFLCPGQREFTSRFFTPECEVPVCGHATIAAFFLAGNRGLIGGQDETVTVIQKTKAGSKPVYVIFERGRVERVFMDQGEPQTLGRVEGENLGQLYSCLGLKKEQVGFPGFKGAQPEIISTGLPDIMVPVLTGEALDRMEPDFPRLAELSRRLGVVGAHVFTPEAEGATVDVRCRNFGPAVGIDEEAATGTSNGALGYYLFKRGLLPGKEIICGQGFGMGSPSAIYVRVSAENIRVGGKATLTGVKDLII